jgi:hypothetical protein
MFSNHFVKGPLIISLHYSATASVDQPSYFSSNIEIIPTLDTIIATEEYKTTQKEMRDVQFPPKRTEQK